MIAPAEWETLCLLIEEGWPGEFDDAAAKAWRVFLDDYEPEEVLVALKALVARGGRFRPSVAEVVAQIRQDPSRPTFEEAFQQLYGPGGIFGFTRSGVVISPWVLKFADRYGRDRLRLLAVDDPDEGKWARKELAEAWDRFLEATEGRDIAQIATRSTRGLKRVDALAVIESGGGE